MQIQGAAVAMLPQVEKQAMPVQTIPAGEEVLEELDELDTQVNYDSMEARARVHLPRRVNWTAVLLGAGSHSDTQIIAPYELAPDESP
jgi:hypothetical protein